MGDEIGGQARSDAHQGFQNRDCPCTALTLDAATTQECTHIDMEASVYMVGKGLHSWTHRVMQARGLSGETNADTRCKHTGCKAVAEWCGASMVTSLRRTLNV